ncbi:MAG: T9SS type A sorting domain-containing protein [Flavobacteriales bacterium]|nr:T9SS type A sorting domain-containing protein [Flavobacteriales bacterium]
MEAVAQPCSASFNVMDQSGGTIANIIAPGEELFVCNSDFLVLDFVGTSTASGGSTISFGEWDLGGSIITNLGPQQFQFSQDATITVSLTIEDLASCSHTASVTIKVLGQPGFDYETTDPTCFGACNGSLAGLYASDNAPLYTHTWSLMGAEIGSGDFVEDQCAGDYTVVVTDEGGCTDYNDSFTLGQPDAIEVSISPQGPVSMCPGDNPLPLSANVSSAELPLTSVAWSWPDGLSAPDQLTTNFTPSSNNLNQVLDINVEDANGCQGTASITLLSRSGGISGTAMIDGAPCIDCEVQYFQYWGQSSVWEHSASNTTDNAGNYELPVLPGLTDCLLRLVAPAVQYPNLPAMYYPNNHNWTDAIIITTGCDADLQKNFSLTSPPAMNGSTIVEGGVYYQHSGKTEAEDPIPGVDVVVEKVPPGNAMTVVTTDADGRFMFEYMEQTLGDTVYNFYVDMPGVPMEDTYFLTLGAGDLWVGNMNFCLIEDSTLIQTCSVLSVTEAEWSADVSLLMYPNPANGIVQFNVQGSKSDVSDAVLIDLTGRVVRNLEPGTSVFELNVNGLSPGLYTAIVRLADGTLLSERLMVGR